MVIYKGGNTGEKGLYWDPVDGQRVDMPHGGILPGDDSKTYLKISPLGLLAIAPLFGMMYVMFLPLFGIGIFIVSWLVIIINSLAKMAMTGIQVCGRITGRSAFFSWHPASAHFSGNRKKKKTGYGEKKGTHQEK
jgi:hypothetical protein